ncbi:PadR family transcriptional regulator [Rhodoferax sp.]|uniref:PadR family transcriptional regulator n=1 Tax=Rhodoferax sp. TaxID=50421 RepID=UPI002840BD14|nr:PadR family transcriptional regulator [Rhodoferax sp.]MDR3370625.1 PadR family transcriptional regulator [Rhodoferax sp.]
MNLALKTQLRKGAIEMCVLAILKRADSYTYELVQQLSAHMAISEGTVYPLMRRLQDEGWVQSYQQESVTGPARKYYRLSASGIDALSMMTREWQEFVAEINSVL